MSVRADVIGDPISHSLSPAMHNYWLEKSGVRGEYKAQKVSPQQLRGYLNNCRADPDWLGCSVTAPLKQIILDLLDEVDETAAELGAVNCVHREGRRLVGTNTDVEGLREAWAGMNLSGAKVGLIGGGGAARAAVHLLQEEGAATIVAVLRRPDAGEALGHDVLAVPLEQAASAFSGASLVINATPLGLRGGDAMPLSMLEAIRHAGAEAAFDMIYRPLETPFLAAAKAGGARTIDGLTMLIGQARRAFTLFFGARPPFNSSDLRDVLTRATG